MNKLLRKFIVLISFCFLFIFSACASLQNSVLTAEEEEVFFPPSSYIPDDFIWQEVCPGIAFFDFENSDFPVIYHAVRIQLETEGLEILTFPDSDFVEEKYIKGDIHEPYVFKSISTKAFAKNNKCNVAMNLTPYIKADLFSKRRLSGVYIDKGNELSQPHDSYSALVINRSPKGFIANLVLSQTPQAFLDCDYAFGGFFTVLEKGQVQENFVRRYDSRSGAGITADGRTLYLLVVEGEKPGKSRGLSYPQCGQIFRAMGCSDALEFDGGGSSELCINGCSVLSYRVLRRQANSFGFKVK